MNEEERNGFDMVCRYVFAVGVKRVFPGRGDSVFDSCYVFILNLRQQGSIIHDNVIADMN